MVGWHHRLEGHQFEQAPGDGDGQGSLELGFLFPVHGVWVRSLVEELRSHVPAMRCGVSGRWFLPWKGTGEHNPPPSGERV